MPFTSLVHCRPIGQDLKVARHSIVTRVPGTYYTGAVLAVEGRLFDLTFINSFGSRLLLKLSEFEFQMYQYQQSLHGFILNKYATKTCSYSNTVPYQVAIYSYHSLLLLARYLVLGTTSRPSRYQVLPRSNSFTLSLALGPRC